MAAPTDCARRCDHHSRWGRSASPVADPLPCPPRLVRKRCRWRQRRLHHRKAPWPAACHRCWCPRCCRRLAQPLPAQQPVPTLFSPHGRRVVCRCRRRLCRRRSHSQPAELRGGAHLTGRPGSPRHGLPGLARLARRSPRQARPRTGGCGPPLGRPCEPACERPHRPVGRSPWPPPPAARGAAADRPHAGPRP